MKKKTAPPVPSERVVIDVPLFGYAFYVAGNQQPSILTPAEFRKVVSDKTWGEVSKLSLGQWAMVGQMWVCKVWLTGAT